ncbi:MAG: dcsG [Gemmatimonadetes bacterium]|nr:dcsG [Gemmatimonadota bacterium]
MSRSVVLATCRHHPSLTASDALLASHLQSCGVIVTAAPWDNLAPAELRDTVVCLRATWDYHKRSDEFRRWISALREREVVLVNPAETVLWNMDKGYLGWLESRGIAIPMTRWIAPGAVIDLPGMLAASGWRRAVLKPRISATAFGTHLVSAATVLGSDEAGVLARSGALLQEFVPEIQSAGEISLMFIDGGFSHAVSKRPSAGDFRVQHEFGGTVGATGASPSLRDFGARVLDAIPVPWTYARVDVVDTHEGPVLMELELIEPDLFFTFGSDGARRLAEALDRQCALPGALQAP